MLRPDILRDKKDFDRLYKRGKAIHGRYVVVIYIRNGLALNRRAFLASKKVGDAVRRNRARRLMKEGYRALAGRLPAATDIEPGAGHDILFIARNAIVGKKCIDVTKEMTTSLKKGKLIR